MSTKEFSLNIYNANDEIVKTYETDVVRWGVFMKAVKLQEEIKDKSEADQLSAITGFMITLFPELTPDELENADVFDIFNTFTQIVNKANNINGGKNSKNAARG